MSLILNILSKSRTIPNFARFRKANVVLTNVKLIQCSACTSEWSKSMRSCHQVVPNLQICIRQKHTKKKSRDDHEEQDDDESEETWETYASDKDSRVVKVKVNSLRTDLVLKSGLAMARNKIETFFYESKIRVNGRKIFKKSSQAHIGDEVDVIRGVSPMNPEFLLVSRVEILDARDNPDGTITVQIRRTKAITVENYEDDNKFV